MEMSKRGLVRDGVRREASKSRQPLAHVGGKEGAAKGGEAAEVGIRDNERVMALFDALAIQPQEDTRALLRVLNYQQSEDGDFVVFTIQVRLGNYEWTVKRRYSEFAALDKTRFASYPQKSFLPGKKVLKSGEFLEQRRADLESYLHTFLELELWLLRQKGLSALPQPLSTFLNFQDYEVHGIVEALASQAAEKGETWLAATRGEGPKAGSKAFFQLHTLELAALTARLQLSEPTFGAGGPRSDVGNVLDFLHRLPHLKVRGGTDFVQGSNIPLNALPFSLHPLKSLVTLWITDCNPQMISGLGAVRRSLRSLVVLYSLSKLSDILVDKEAVPVVDMREKERAESSASSSSAKSQDDEELFANGSWPLVQEADFSFNQLVEIEDCIGLLPRCRKLNLSNNRLSDIGFTLQHLTSLRILDLSHNGLERLDLWHASSMRMWGFEVLDLSRNSIRSLSGLSRLYSLEELGLAENAVATTTEVWALQSLQCLVRLTLKGNPLESAVDYRSRVLEVGLGLAENAVATTTEVWALQSLQCLVRLTLKGNPLESAVDYRSRVLEVGLGLAENAVATTTEVWALQSLQCLVRLTLKGNPLESAVDYRSRVLEVGLGLAENAVATTTEVWALQSLQCLVRLTLKGNPLESAVDYRSRVLEVGLGLAENAVATTTEVWALQSLQCLVRLTLKGNPLESAVDYRSRVLEVGLGLAENAVATTTEVWALQSLQCLVRLTLKGNPLESAVDYRSRVLEVFGERASEVRLDGRRASQRELDTVNVRLALRKAKEDRERQLANNELIEGSDEEADWR